MIGLWLLLEKLQGANIGDRPLLLMALLCFPHRGATLLLRAAVGAAMRTYHESQGARSTGCGPLLRGRAGATAVPEGASA